MTSHNPSWNPGLKILHISTLRLQIARSNFFHTNCTKIRAIRNSIVCNQWPTFKMWHYQHSSVNNQQPAYQQAHYWTQMLTSLVRVGAPGLVINAIPLHTTAVSSTNTHSGKDSSGGNSITSKPSSRRSRTYASCWRFASSSSISPLVRNDNGMRHTTACVYFHDAIL